ncbi:MAG: hypothetical protein II978_04575 [Clostridia bacterium]|nr:hypothetical protein [Clostridia bacterium]
MISKIIVDSVILFLLIYALFDIFISISDWLSEKLLCKKENVSHFVILLDKTQNIELHVKKTINEIGGCGNIVIMYENSSGDKFKTAQMLCSKYQGVVLLSKDEYQRYLEIKQQA